MDSPTTYAAHGSVPCGTPVPAVRACHPWPNCLRAAREELVSTSFRTSTLAIVTLALGAAVWLAALGSCGLDSTPPTLGTSADHRRLVSLMRSERTIEPRLAGGFQHTPCDRDPGIGDILLPPPGCNQDKLQPDTSTRLGEAGPGFASTPDLHARGVWRLFFDLDAKAVAAAVSEIRAAASRQPSPARWNDLTAALIVEARASQNPVALIEALDWNSRVLNAEPRHPEALYNRALLLEDLGLEKESNQAWQRFLNAELDPDWKSEVVRRLEIRTRGQVAAPYLDRLAEGDALDVAVVTALDSEAVRRVALDRLFEAWSEAVLNSDTVRADARLNTLRVVGSELRRVTGDHLVADGVAAIDETREVKILAEAHRDLAVGRRYMAESRYGEAVRRLEAARERFQRAGSPMEAWADFWIAICDSSTNRWGRTLDRAESLLSRNDLVRFPVLVARSRWARGLIELRIGDYEASLEDFRAAARLFEEMGERSLAASVTAVSAEAYQALGRSLDAWRQRVTALHGLKPSAERALHNLLIDSSIAAREEGYDRAAVILQGFGVERAAGKGSTSRWVEALLWRSRAWAALGRVDKAREDLSQAWGALGGIPSEGLRRRMRASLEEAEAGYLMEVDPEGAIHRLDRVLTFREEMRYHLDTASTLQDRAAALLSLGDREGARRDLQRAVRIYERHDLQVLSDLYRRDHFELAQSAFETLIPLYLEDGHLWEALALAERAQLGAVRRTTAAQQRLDGAEPPPPAPVLQGQDLRRWASRQPKDTVFLTYTVLSDRMMIWRLWEGHLTQWQAPISRSHLRAEIEGLTRGLRSARSGHAFESALQRVSSLLVGDVLTGMPSDLTLRIVADRELTSVPFLALRQASGRYLIEDFAVVRTLSLRQSMPAAPPVSGSFAVVVGDPVAAEFSSLPEARREARQVVDLYPQAIHLEGGEADRQSLLDHLGAATVFHFSGHGMDDPASPWSSYLAVSPTPGTENDRLFARDLMALDLSHLQLGVLAGCSTARGRLERATPVSGLTLSLLEAGASAVLSTLWDVEDDTLGPVLVSFHEQITVGAPPAEALRAAVLSQRLDPGTPPSRWAPLVLFEQSNL